MDAILRQLAYYTNHVGQIMLFAKHLEWGHWKYVTFERNAEILDIKNIKNNNIFFYYNESHPFLLILFRRITKVNVGIKIIELKGIEELGFSSKIQVVGSPYVL